MCHLGARAFLLDMLWRAELEVRNERDLHKNQLRVDCPGHWWMPTLFTRPQIGKAPSLGNPMRRLELPLLGSNQVSPDPEWHHN